ncbi:methyltransferase [Actinomadura sp. 9N215]|uniref:methyltransferase n=1 Tax=Actinomadura sp. 9N215 TaxID=3375150 RepID=UPI0037B43BAF
MFTDPAMLRAWEHLEDSVRTGRTSFDQLHGKNFFAHLKENPGLSALFNAAMSQGTRATADALPARYDFGRFRTIVDVGGGDGTLLAAVLRAHPPARGILFDTPEGLAQAPDTLRREGVDERCTLQTGDFFATVPGGGDLYLPELLYIDSSIPQRGWVKVGPVVEPKGDLAVAHHQQLGLVSARPPARPRTSWRPC